MSAYLQGHQECVHLMESAERKQRKLQTEIHWVLDAIAERRARRYQLLAQHAQVNPQDIARREQSHLDEFSHSISAPGLDAVLYPPEARRRNRDWWGHGRDWSKGPPPRASSSPRASLRGRSSRENAKRELSNDPDTSDKEADTPPRSHDRKRAPVTGYPERSGSQDSRPSPDMHPAMDADPSPRESMTRSSLPRSSLSGTSSDFEA